MKIAVILPAAGSGRRFGQRPKIEQDLAGRPVFLRAVELFVNHPGVEQVLIAVNPKTCDQFKFKWGDKLAFHGVKLVEGGTKDRWETVLKTLNQIPPAATHVAVHDAARPLASSKLIQAVFEAAARYHAVIPGLPINGTLKRVEADPHAAGQADRLDDILGKAAKTAAAQRVVETINRRDLVEVQTPQIFQCDLLKRAYAQIAEGKVNTNMITDDASLVEALGEPVHVVEGEMTNLKIPRPDDLTLAEAVYLATHRNEAQLLARKRLFGDEDD